MFTKLSLVMDKSTQIEASLTRWSLEDTAAILD